MNKNNPHHDWDKLFDQLPLDTAPDDSHRQKLKQQSLDAFDAANEPAVAGIDNPVPTVQAKPQRNPVGGLKKTGRVLMTYKTHYWTTAAILIGCIIWMTQDSNRAYAFENFVERMKDCKTYRFVMETDVGGEKLATKFLYLTPGKYRSEMDDTVVTIDVRTKKALTLDKKGLTAQISDLADTTDFPVGNTNVMEQLKGSFLDFTNDPDRKIKKLEPRVVDGVTVRGYQVESNWGLRQSGTEPVRDEDILSRISLWEDPDTDLPVLIEIEMVAMGEVEFVMTIKDFEFDVELDESLFSLDVPDGYTLEAAEEIVMFAEETEFIASLKKLSTSMGKFPSSFDADQLQLLMGEYAKREGLDVQAEGWVERLMTESINLITPLMAFANSMPPSADAHYKPDGVAVGDKSRAIFWYKPMDEETCQTQETYRVIYGDFSVKEQDLPPHSE